MKLVEFKDIIWDYTRKIEESMSSMYHPIAEKHGLTMMQIRLLIELQQSSSHTIGSLADRVCVAGANVSAMCKRLEAQGLLERIRNREDERVVLVALTEQGQKTVQQIDQMFHERFSMKLTDETETDFDDIILGLKKLSEMLHEMNSVTKE